MPLVIRPVLLLAWAILLLLPVLPAQDPAPNYQHGYRFYQQKDYAQAIVCLEKVIAAAKFEKDRGVQADACYLLALCHYHRGQTRQVIAYCEKALSWRPEDVDVLYLQAKAGHALGENDAAIAALGKVVQIYPDNVFAVYLMGRCYQFQGRIDLAEEKYRRALQLWGNYAPAYRQLGQCYIETKHWDQARAMLTKALAIAPDMADVYGYRAQVLAATGAEDLAIADLQQAIKYAPRDGDNWYRLGVLQQRQKKYAQALASYQSAYSLLKGERQNQVLLRQGMVLFHLGHYRPALNKITASQSTDKESYLYRARIQMQMGNHDAAIAELDQALRYDPRFWLAYLERIKIYLAQNKNYQAIKECQNIQALGYEEADLYYYLGKGRQRLGNDEQALDAYQRSIQRHDGYADAHAALSEVRQQIADNRFGDDRIAIYRIALKDIEKAIALQPEKAAYYNQRGLLYSALHQYQQAVGDFTQAVKLDAGPAEFYFNRANTYRQLDQRQTAIVDYSSAIERQPQQASYYHGRGVVYSRQDDLVKALVDFDMAVKLRPANAETLFQRSVVYQKMGKLQQALADIDKAIKLADSQAPFYYHRAGLCYTLARYDQALRDCNSALVNNPENKDYFRLRARIYRKLGEFEKAARDSKKGEDMPK